LVFAGIGAASGVLDKPLQAAIIIMVILTTFIAPPLLRFAFGTEGQVEEVEEVDLASSNNQ
jgi:Kef-type K+ transport system membrane component KefB